MLKVIIREVSENKFTAVVNNDNFYCKTDICGTIEDALRCLHSDLASIDTYGNGLFEREFVVIHQ